MCNGAAHRVSAIVATCGAGLEMLLPDSRKASRYYNLRQSYGLLFHSRQFKETFSPQREAANRKSSIYLTVRWQALHFDCQIPKEHQREILPGSRSFATLTLG